MNLGEVMPGVPGFVAFELDLMKAVMDQLVPNLEKMSSATLSFESARALPDAQGVYLLIHENQIRYVGKTDAEAGLRTRLVRHTRKFEHRKNIIPSDVSFKAAQILVLTAMDVESRLIRHFHADWNGSGFGSNDPGRERETTNKPEQGFDARFPINIDIDGSYLPSGECSILEALIRLKETLPYTIRYEVMGKGSQAYRTKPHPDYSDSRMNVPVGSYTLRQLMRIIVDALPAGWQATEFVSHVILYKENRTYLHGRTL